jgi:penicillin amidase
MSAVQNDAVSPYGRLYTPAFIAELDRAIEEAATPGTHPDLETVVAAIAAADMAKIEDMRDRLAAWTSFDTPAAVEGAPTAQEIADSVATTIFNAAFGRILGLALSDEYEALDSWNGFRSRTFANMLLEPDGMVTYDATLRDGAGDSVLWDDITTAEIESRGQRILAGFVAALDYLETDVDADPNEWRWGRLHTLRLRTTVPQLGGDALSIPLPTDPMFPDGFPRHGDNGVVDASSYGIGDTTDFSYGSGPQQRLVVEMTPERPLIWNAIPGGQSIDPDSPHHADEIELWRTNQAPPMNWTEEEVLAAHERRIVFSP